MVEYLLLRSHALKTRLLPRMVLQELLSAETFSDFVDILRLTNYNIELVKITKFDAHIFEKMFNERLVERYRFLLNSADKKAWELISAYSRKLEVQNIIKILRSKASNTPSEHIKEKLLSLEDISYLDLETMLNISSFEDAVRSLEHTIYEDVVGSLEWHSKYRSMLPIQAHLKSIYYGHLLKTLSRIPRGDRKELKRFIGTEIDIANCITSIAWGTNGFDEDFAKKLIIPFSFRISAENLVECFYTKDTTAIKRLFRPYSRIVDHILEENYDMAEVEALKYIHNEAMQEFTKGTTYAYILSCLFLCEVECRDLSYLALAKQYGIKPEDMAKRMISLG